VRGALGHGESFEDAIADWRRAAALYRESFGALEFTRDESATPDAIELETVTASAAQKVVGVRAMVIVGLSLSMRGGACVVVARPTRRRPNHL
jgi:hypothetical protein